MYKRTSNSTLLVVSIEESVLIQIQVVFINLLTRLM